MDQTQFQIKHELSELYLPAEEVCVLDFRRNFS